MNAQGTEPAFSFVSSGGILTLRPNYAFDSVRLKQLAGMLYADQFPGGSVQAKLNAAVAAAPATDGVVIAPPGMGAGVPSSVPSGVTYIGYNGVSASSPGGIAITQGTPPEALAANVLLNAKQMASSPGSTPQNTAYIEQTVTGALAGNTQNTNWAIFAAGQVSSPTSDQAGEEEDGLEGEASAIGSGTWPNLVGVGAQTLVYDSAGSSIAVNQADSMYARAPILASSGGTATLADAISMRVDTPNAGSANNAGIQNSSLDAAHPAIEQIATAGTPVWQWITNTFATQTDDLWLQSQNVPGGGTSADIYLSHGGAEGRTGGAGPLYLTAGGSASVVINGEPTHPNFGGTTNGTGGLAIYAGGASGSLSPVASVGLIRLPNNTGIVARNAANSADITLIQTNAANNVVIDANAQGTLFGGQITIGNGSAVTGIIRAAIDIAFSAIAAGTCQEQTVGLTGLLASAGVLASPSSPIGSNLAWSASPTSGAARIRVCNPTGASITPVEVTWNIVAIQ